MNGYKTSEFKYTYILKWIRGYVVTQSVIIIVYEKRIRGYMDKQSVIISVCKKRITLTLTLT